MQRFLMAVGSAASLSLDLNSERTEKLLCQLNKYRSASVNRFSGASVIPGSNYLNLLGKIKLGGGGEIACRIPSAAAEFSQ